MELIWKRTWQYKLNRYKRVFFKQIFTLDFLQVQVSDHCKSWEMYRMIINLILSDDADKKPLIVGNKHWRGYNINEIYWFDLSKAKIVFYIFKLDDITMQMQWNNNCDNQLSLYSKYFITISTTGSYYKYNSIINSFLIIIFFLIWSKRFQTSILEYTGCLIMKEVKYEPCV